MKNIFVILRVCIGVVFIVSGVEKLLSPLENIVFVVQGYDLLHHAVLERALAFCLPWAELLTGVFLIVGLWLRLAVLVTGLMSLMFAVAVSQAMWRGLPITDCGCFGDLAHFPLWVTLVVDLTLLTGAVLLWKGMAAARRWSMDRLFE